MDIPRKSQARIRLIRRIVLGIVAMAAIAGVSWYVSKLERAAPAVDRAQVWIDTVKRGNIDRDVRGLGKLVPKEIRWVTAVTSGTVEKKLLEAGARVSPGTVLLELSNPQLEQETLNAEWDWKSEESSYIDLKVRLERERLDQKANLAQLQSQLEEAKLEYEIYSELNRNGLFSKLDLRKYETKVDQTRNRLDIEKQRQDIYTESVKAQLAQKQTGINKSRELFNLRKSHLEQLKVRAGVAGVLQEIPVEIGEQVGPGTNLARVANPEKLKAELNVAETQAKDIQVGQDVSVEALNSSIPGRVSRIDPAVREGTVEVDVELLAELPKGARPDLSVDGKIILEKLEDIVYMGIPAQGGQQNSRIGLFKLDPDGKRAVRVPVKLGRKSVSTIEVLEGLKPGDQVILTNMSDHDDSDRIRLN